MNALIVNPFETTVLEVELETARLPDRKGPSASAAPSSRHSEKALEVLRRRAGFARS